MITEPGIYTLPLAEYVADPAPAPSLSSGIAHVLITQSARHAYWQHPKLNPACVPEQAERLDVGTASHALLLEADNTKIVVVQAKDYRTKDARETRDAAYAAGLIPVLIEQMEAVTAMVEAAKKAIATSEVAPAFRPRRGKPEQTLLWQEGSIWLRTRPDQLSNDFKIICDYKTTAASAEPTAWARGPMLTHGCELQAALGIRGIRKLTKEQNPTFVFIVQECESPYAVSFVSLSPEFQAFAEKKLERAIATWQHCLTSDVWPSYPTRICWMDLPPWVESRFAERAWITEPESMR